MTSQSLKRKAGQNTAEYIIILVLIAGGSLAIFEHFGSTVRQHLKNMTNAFAGKKFDVEETASYEGNAADLDMGNLHEENKKAGGGI